MTHVTCDGSLLASKLWRLFHVAVLTAEVIVAFSEVWKYNCKELHGKSHDIQEYAWRPEETHETPQEIRSPAVAPVGDTYNATQL